MNTLRPSAYQEHPHFHSGPAAERDPSNQGSAMRDTRAMANRQAQLKPRKPARSLHHLVGNHPASQSAQLSASMRAGGKEVVQRSLPKDGEPNTQGMYNADPASQEMAYSGTGRPSQFSKNFRNYILQLRAQTRWTDKDIMLVQEQEGDHYWLPEDVYQLDHVYPWKSIAEDLHFLAGHFTSKVANGTLPPPAIQELFVAWDLANNNSVAWNDHNLQAGVNHGQVAIRPSVYAARMYFHDVGNLSPMTAGRNAAKNDTEMDTHSETPVTSNIEGDLTVMFYRMIDNIRNQDEPTIKGHLRDFRQEVRDYAHDDI